MLVKKLLNVTSFANCRVSRKVVSSNFDIATYVVVLLCTGGDAGTVTCLELCHDPSNAHRRVHNSRNLSHMNPVHAVPFYFFKIHLNIILTSAPTSYKCFPSGFPINAIPVCVSLPHHMCHATLISLGLITRHQPP